jgi:hypothetical protein
MIRAIAAAVVCYATSGAIWWMCQHTEGIALVVTLGGTAVAVAYGIIRGLLEPRSDNG